MTAGVGTGTIARSAGAATTPTTRLDAALVGAALVVLGAAVRIASVLATRDMRLVDDPADYHRLGLSLAHGRGFGDTVLAAGGGPTSFRPPLYPLFLGAVYRVTGDSVLAARLLQAMLGAVAVALIGWIAYRLAGRTVALLATGIAAVYPPLVLVGSSLLSESLSLPLELAGVAAALEYRRDHQRRWLVLAGVAGGLGVLARPVSAVFVLAFAFLVWDRRPRLSLRALAAPVAVGIVAIVTVVPWLVRDYARFDRFVPVSTLDGFVVAGVYNHDADTDPDHPGVFRVPIAVPALAPLFSDMRLDEVELSSRLKDAGVDYVRAHPAYVGEVVAWNTARLFDLTGPGFVRETAASLGIRERAADIWFASYVLVAVTAVIGLFTTAARRVPRALWAVPLLVVAGTVATLGTARYRSPVEPFLVLLAAMAIAAVVDRRAEAA